MRRLATFGAIALALTAAAFLPVAVPATKPSAAVKVSADDLSHGTGVHIGGGLVLTAAHVIGGKVKLAVNGLAVETLWLSRKYDVALLRVAGLDATIAPLRCESPFPGEHVRLVSAPLNLGMTETWGRVASSDSQSFFAWAEIIIADLTLGPGSSGGPVFDQRGRVVGLAVGWLPPSGFAFVVPSVTVCRLLGRT